MLIYYKRVKENHRLTNNKKKEVPMTLLYGKPANQRNPNGLVHGEKVDQDGTLNAQSWLVPFWEILLIYMQVALI